MSAGDDDIYSSTRWWERNQESDSTAISSIKEDEEIERILGEFEDDLPLNDVVETSEPTADIKPVIQDQSIDLEGLSDADLRAKYTETFANEFKYSSKLRQLNNDIAMEFAKRGIPPASREYVGADPVACRNEDYSYYMNDLQVFDLYWIWLNYRSHITNTSACDGLFSGIFLGDVFNFDQAFKIAIGATTVKGKNKNLNRTNKIKFLRLPECMQMDLATLRTDAIRKKQGREKQKKREVEERFDSLLVQSMDIRCKLEAYAKQSDSRIRNIDSYVNTWLSVKVCPKSTAEALREYSNRTGKTIGRTTFTNIVKLLKKLKIT